MSPVVDGRVHHFGARGVYNGLLLIGDHETGSFWDHITGRCVYGPLTGRQLESSPLLHANVAQALAQHPDCHLAVSRLTLLQKLNVVCMRPFLKSRRGFFPPVFKNTMSAEDRRRPRMDIGLGVWAQQSQRYYPLATLRQCGSAVVDSLGGRGLLVYIDPASGTPAAFYTDAGGCTWRGGDLLLDNAQAVREGRLCNADSGTALESERPMQMFTRWYGFACTFPGCDIFEK